MSFNSHPIKLIAAVVTVALASTFAAAVSAAPGGPGMMGQGPMGGPMMGGMLPRLLDSVNATPEQRAQIKQITDAASTEMRTQHEASRALRDQAMPLFIQPTVDAYAVEALRQKQMAMHDAASKRMMAAMLEISRVLTPEQRKQMATQMTQRREMMQRHYRERQSLEAPKS